MNLSLEIFPPKYGEPLGETRELITEIAKFKPEFLSITYRATEGYCHGTFDCLKYALNQEIVAIPHITSCALTASKLEEILNGLTELKVKNFLALSGDPLPTGEFRQCTDMLDWYRDVGWQKDMENKWPKPMAACYPEKHPRGASYQTELDIMKKKVNSGVTDFITQLFFDNDLFYRFLNRVHNADINAIIHAGIMPVTKTTQIRRIVELSHAFFPRKFEETIDKFGDNPKAMRQAGIAYAINQIVDLKANGVDHIHLYMMNDIDLVKSIVRNIGCVLNS